MADTLGPGGRRWRSDGCKMNMQGDDGGEPSAGHTGSKTSCVLPGARMATPQTPPLKLTTMMLC